MADPILVPQNHEEGNPALASEQLEPSPSRYGAETPTVAQDDVVRAAVLVGRPVQDGLTTMAESLIALSTRPKTKVKYSSIEKKWLHYCSTNNFSTNATTATFANFLAEEFQRGLKYTYLRGYTSALAGYTREVDHITLARLLKGIHNCRPPTPRYTAIWDVNMVLEYIAAMITDSLMDMTLKTAALLMLLSGNRVNMLSNFRVDSMILTDTECTFRFPNVLKHTRPGKTENPMVFRAYPENSSLCPVKTILKYLEKRGPFSNAVELFIITRKPYTVAHHDTIARWLKKVLEYSGVNTGEYSAHSYRAASTSAAALGGVSITTILKSACWSNVGTFKQHYQRELELVYEEPNVNFGTEILEMYHSM